MISKSNPREFCVDLCLDIEICLFKSTKVILIQDLRHDQVDNELHFGESSIKDLFLIFLPLSC